MTNSPTMKKINITSYCPTDAKPINWPVPLHYSQKPQQFVRQSIHFANDKDVNTKKYLVMVIILIPGNSESSNNVFQVNPCKLKFDFRWH